MLPQLAPTVGGLGKTRYSSRMSDIHDHLVLFIMGQCAWVCMKGQRLNHIIIIDGGVCSDRDTIHDIQYIHTIINGSNR